MSLSGANGAEVKVTFAPTGEVCSAGTGDTVLFAGLSAGSSLPYDCASGSCGMCKARLISGTVSNRWPEAPGLTDRDRRKGNVILMCQSEPVSDCKLKTSLLPSMEAPAPLRCEGRICARRVLTSNMVEFTVGTSQDVPFFAGQYCLLSFDGETRRAYSMSSTPDKASELKFIVKVKADGSLSPRLYSQEAIGKTVFVEGPYGNAYLRKDLSRPVVGIAGGSGLAPVWSIAKEAAREPRREIHLYFGMNSDADVCFEGDFEDLKTVSNSVRTAHVVAKSDNEKFRSGLVGQAVTDDFDSLKHADVYMAGPPAMIDTITEQFLTQDLVDLRRVYFDRFA